MTGHDHRSGGQQQAGGAGRADRAAGVVHDATERERGEQALRLFKDALDNSTDAIGMSTPEGRHYYQNRAFDTLFGHIGENPPASLYVDRAVGEEVFRTIMAGGQWTGEVPMYAADRRILDISLRAYANRDEAGRILSLVGIHNDITARRRAEEALRESEERYKTIVSSMSDLIFVVDEDDRFVDVHCRQPSDSLMLPPDEFLGKAVADVLPPDIYEQHRACAARVRKSGASGRYAYSLPIRGETRWFLASFDLHADGKRIVAGVRDITRRKQAEAALQRAHDELEQRVKKRTADLSAANAQLRRERQTLEHMLRASDHERQLIAYDIHDGLAQELAGAIMQLQIYEQQKDTRPTDAQTAFDGGMVLLRQGHSEARRLISGVRPPILDESGVLAAVAHLAYEPAFERGPKVEFRSRVTFHRLDPVAENVIYRIVREALSNARNHSRSDRVVVSLVERGEVLRIEVRDWGVGFDPQEVQQNRFGLEGIRERARLLGGQCRIRSRPGGGTVVAVKLPVPHPREGIR